MASTQPFQVEFSGDLSIRAISKAHGVLTQALDAHDAVVADVDEAAEIDLTFIQLLVSARRTAAAAGKSFELARPAVGQLLETLNRGGFINEADVESRSFWLAEAGAQK